MYQTMLDAYRLNSSDVIVKNNLASLGLLLNRDIERSHQLAQEVYEKDPSHEGFLTTFVLSLIVQKEYQRAFDLVNKQVIPQPKSPSTLLCRAILLAKLGRKSEAENISLSLDRDDFLREEWSLLEQALILEE